MYKILQVHVASGTTETLSVPYAHTVEELYFWAFPDAPESASEIDYGSVESWIDAGKCVALGEGKYQFFGAFACGYTVFVARKSDADTEPKQKPYNAFPLATVIQAVLELKKRAEEDALEIARALRSPEAEGKMILPMKKTRADKLLGFDSEGRPVVGDACRQVGQLMSAQENCSAYVEQAKRYAKESENHAVVSEKMAASSALAADEAEEWTDAAKDAAKKAEGWLQKVGEEAANVLSLIEERKNAADAEINGRLSDVVASVGESYGRITELYSEISERYDEIAAIGALLKKAQCFICCAAKKTETNRRSIEDLLALNADGLNALDETRSAIAELQEGAAASSALLSKKADALTCGEPATASTGDGSAWIYVGPLSALGVTGAAANVNALTFYRRASSGDTTDASLPVYCRVLKKITDATGNKIWQICSQSANAVAFAEQPSNGGAIPTFYMRRVSVHVEPPTCTETVAIAFVAAPDSPLHENKKFGCKVVSSTTGGMCANWGLDLAISLDKGQVALIPACVVSWTPYAPGGLAKAEDLDGKASAADLTALAARVSTAETSLSSKANASTVTALATRVTTAETTLANKANASTVNELATHVTTVETDLGGKKFVVLTQEAYDALETKDESTLYFIKAA